MSFKMILGLGILFIDFIIVLWLIGLIGLKNFGLFFLFFMIGSFLWSIIFRLTGVIDEDIWKITYKLHNGKIRYGILLFDVLIIIAGVLYTYLNIFPLWLVASVVSGFVVGLLNAFSGEFLYTLFLFQQSLNKVLLEMLKDKKTTGKKRFFK